MRTRSLLTAVVVAFACSGSSLLWAADDSSDVSKVDAALAESQNTGKPILAIGISKTCPSCQALKERLQTDKSLQPLLSNFVPLVLSTDAGESGDWSNFERKFPSEGNGIPKVYVVRADGEKLHAGSGAPEKLPEFLKEKLAESGRPLTEKQAEQLKLLVAAATKLSDAGSLAAAMAKLKPALGAKSYAKPAVAAEELGKSLAEKVQATVDEADGKLSSPDEAIGAAVTLVETFRVYSKTLPDVAKGVNEKLVKYRKNPEKRELFKQADLVDKASVMAVKNSAKGLSMFQAIVAKHPDTPVAALAETKIKELEALGASADTKTAAKKPTGKSAAADLAAAAGDASPEQIAKLAASIDPKKMASIMKMAKTFAAQNPGKARKYLQQVIDANPDSAAAVEAQKLLDSLQK